MKTAIVASSSSPVRATYPALARWQLALKSAVRDPLELCRLLDLPTELEEPARRAARTFPLFAPRHYIDQMQRGDPSDPLLQQVLPLAAELQDTDGFTPDPVGDLDVVAQPGLLRKYAGRALLIATGACAVHCRYCFRRHFPYHETPQSIADWQPALDQVAADHSIEEIILSGGDPLTMVDAKVGELVVKIAEIPHVRRLRVHTRLPIMIPERVTAELVEWLTGTRLTSIMVVHANHPAELDARVGAALNRLRKAGIMLLNQAVLLRGVNDELETLTHLSTRLVDLGVTPYYLHQLDRVAGAAHFEVPVETGIRLVTQLRARLPGYAVPRYVREVPGQLNKVVLA